MQLAVKPVFLMPENNPLYDAPARMPQVDFGRPFEPERLLSCDALSRLHLELPGHAGRVLLDSDRKAGRDAAIFP